MPDTSASITTTILISIGVWLIVLIAVLFSINKRKDMPTPVKIFWAIIIFIAPVLGLIFYLVFSTWKNPVGKHSS